MTCIPQTAFSYWLSLFFDGSTSPRYVGRSKNFDRQHWTWEHMTTLQLRFDLYVEFRRSLTSWGLLERFTVTLQFHVLTIVYFSSGSCSRLRLNS